MKQFYIAVHLQRYFFAHRTAPFLGPNSFLCSVKILILHQHFKVPQRGGAVRSYYLSKALADKGVAVSVVTAHNEPRYRKECLDGIEVHYLPIPYDNRFGFYRRTFSFYQFVWQSVKFVGSSLRHADLCYAISTPLTTGIVAMRMLKKHKIPYIFEVGDLWPDAPVQMGVITNPVFKYLLYRLEKAIYKKASSIVALSPSIRDFVQAKVPGKPVHIITNMSDTDFFRPGRKVPALKEKFGVRDNFVVAYIGAIGVANGLEYFLKCAEASQVSNLRVHFLLCGDGAMLEPLKELAGRIVLRNLTFIPFRNRDGVAEVMNVTDANFICYQTVNILETGSPNKYFDGLAAGKLTVINFGGWIRHEIEKERCGIFVNPEDPNHFVTAILPFVDDEQLLRCYQRAGRKLAERKYSRKVVGERFSEIVINEIPR